MEKERKRASNYTTREKEILISFVQNYITILENKKTNAVFNKEKLKCWEHLAREYNALQTTGIRTATQLRAAYEQMKKIAKQHKSEDKVDINLISTLRMFLFGIVMLFAGGNVQNRGRYFYT